mgnify:CR=1 FL=1
MKSFVFAALLSCLLALGLSACQEQADPRIPELERQRDAALEESDTWQMVGILGGIGVMLFVGAGLGSSARRKSGGSDG